MFTRSCRTVDRVIKRRRITSSQITTAGCHVHARTLLGLHPSISGIVRTSKDHGHFHTDLGARKQESPLRRDNQDPTVHAHHNITTTASNHRLTVGEVCRRLSLLCASLDIAINTAGKQAQFVTSTLSASTRATRTSVSTSLPAVVTA